MSITYYIIVFLQYCNYQFNFHYFSHIKHSSTPTHYRRSLRLLVATLARSSRPGLCRTRGRHPRRSRSSGTTSGCSSARPTRVRWGIVGAVHRTHLLFAASVHLLPSLDNFIRVFKGSSLKGGVKVKVNAAVAISRPHHISIVLSSSSSTSPFSFPSPASHCP